MLEKHPIFKGKHTQCISQTQLIASTPLLQTAVLIRATACTSHLKANTPKLQNLLQDEWNSITCERTSRSRLTNTWRLIKYAYSPASAGLCFPPLTAAKPSNISCPVTEHEQRGACLMTPLTCLLSQFSKVGPSPTTVAYKIYYLGRGTLPLNPAALAALNHTVLFRTFQLYSNKVSAVWDSEVFAKTEHLLDR